MTNVRVLWYLRVLNKTWKISGKDNELYFGKNDGIQVWMNESQRDSWFLFKEDKVSDKFSRLRITKKY